MKTVNLIQGSEDWHAYRKTKVGASEMSYLFGCNPWCSANDQEKHLIGLKLGFNQIFINQAMRDGNEAEDKIVEWVENQYGLLTQPLVGYKGDVSSSYDGIDFEYENVIEVKNSTHTYNFLKTFDKVPHNYYLQCQTQLYVSGAERCYFASRNTDTGDISVKIVEPNPTTFKDIEEKVKKFFDLMNSKTWKEDDFSEQRSDKEWSEAVAEYKTAKAIFDESKLVVDNAKKKLIELTGGLSTKGAGVTVYLTKPRVTVNYKQVILDNEIEIDDKYKKTGSSSWGVRITKEN